ncbi:type I toxin-antitoxin system Fst family toxin [Mammaliicoccus sciuri]
MTFVHIVAPIIYGYAIAYFTHWPENYKNNRRHLANTNNKHKHYSI